MYFYCTLYFLRYDHIQCAERLIMPGSLQQIYHLAHPFLSCDRLKSWFMWCVIRSFYFLATRTSFF